jgi:hypothetical protein
MPRRDWTLGAAAFIVGTLVSFAGVSQGAPGPRLNGFDVIQSPDHPFGSAAAAQALAAAKKLGANAIAVVPFFWQAGPASADLVRGKDMSDDQLRAAIRDGHSLGLAVVVKPQVWVPNSWAGAVAMTSAAAWTQWFANYRTQLDRIALIAEQEKADALAIGTELERASQQPDWGELIGYVRMLYSGSLVYFAHNLDEAKKVPFWRQLDAIGVTLYPPLGSDGDRIGRLATIAEVAGGLDALSARIGKPVIVGEIGLRSAEGAAAKPWQSAEERASPPDLGLQADVLADWLSILDRPSIRGVLVWRWLTDPNAGGTNDTDFTVQGKPAEAVLRCAWTRRCK